MTSAPNLAFDCAIDGATVALCVDGQTHETSLPQQRQAADLVPAIDGLLREHQIAYAAISCIVTTVGPGSFTGVRIGLATLHGLALAHATPIKLVSTLEAIAYTHYHHHPKDGPRTATLRAGKGEYYAQRFLPAATPTHAHAPAEIVLVPETTLHWNDAAPIGHAAPPDSSAYQSAPRAAMLCAMAPHLSHTDLAHALPLYVRAPDAKIPSALPWLTAASPPTA